MWKPNTVVSEHKQRARAVWIILLLTTLAYTIWQIVDVAKQHENPSTTLSISNDRYDFPNVNICFLDGYGCQFVDGNCDNCLNTVDSSVDFDGETFENIHTFPDGYTNCMTFDVSALLAESASASSLEEGPHISMSWTASTSPSNDTEYWEMIGVILGGFETVELTYIPYTRTEFPRTEDVPDAMSVVMIQKTHRTFLSGEEADMFAIWSIATAAGTPLEIAEFDQDTRAIGRLFLKIEQAPYSLVGISDDKPLSVGSLLGNIGGFWELLLVAWAVFFVSTRSEADPEFKARDLTDSIKKGKEAVGRRLGRSRAAASPQTTEPAIEQQPDWEAPYRAAFAATDSARENAFTNRAAVGDPSGQPSTGASFWRRPVEIDTPSRAGGTSSPPPL